MWWKSLILLHLAFTEVIIINNNNGTGVPALINLLRRRRRGGPRNAESFFYFVFFWWRDGNNGGLWEEFIGSERSGNIWFFFYCLKTSNLWHWLKAAIAPFWYFWKPVFCFCCLKKRSLHIKINDSPDDRLVRKIKSSGIFILQLTLWTSSYRISKS